MPRCNGRLLLQRTLLPCLPADQEVKDSGVSSMHDPKALSMPNIPEGSIAQQGKEVQRAAGLRRQDAPSRCGSSSVTTTLPLNRLPPLCKQF